MSWAIFTWLDTIKIIGLILISFTFGLARNASTYLHRDGRRLQNVLVERLKTIEMVVVLFVLARFPREINIAYLYYTSSNQMDKPNYLYTIQLFFKISWTWVV